MCTKQLVSLVCLFMLWFIQYELFCERGGEQFKGETSGALNT